VLLTVHENVNAGWRATLGGRELQRITVDGWQQGYVVPAGAPGVVHLVYTPDRWYRLGLAAGLLAALLVLGGALLPERRGRGAALAPSRGTAVTVLGAACLVLAGGVWAVVLLAAALGLRSAAARRWPGAARRLSLWGPAVSFAVAGGAVAVWPWPTPGYPGGGAVTQLLCLAALALVWAPAPRRRDRAAGGAGAAARAGAS
jgi:arabinofuranan 3-O-arabinosyltransferase